MTATTASATGDRPGAARLGWERFRIELKQFFRERESVVFTFSLPMLLMVIFGSVFGKQTLGDSDVTFGQYFLAGMIASGLMYSAFQQLAITIPMERDDGTLKRLHGTPMPKSSYFLGKIGVVCVVYVAQVVLLLAIGMALFDVSLPSTSRQWLTFAWVSVLGLASCTLLGIAFSSLPRGGRSASAWVTPVVLVLQFTSGVFFVFSELPEWMQRVASMFPLKWMTQAMRSVFLPDLFASQEPAGRWELGPSALVLGAWTMIGLVLCLTTFRWLRREDG